MANALDQTLYNRILVSLTPSGTAGIPGTSFVALGAGAMKLKLFSSASSATAAGTEITGGSGYTTGGTAFSTASAAPSGAGGVTMPHTTAISWTNTSTAWSIVGLEIVDSVPIRVWWGNWNGQPIGVATGNTFQVAAEAIVATLT
jgi:hypothetical protein